MTTYFDFMNKDINEVILFKLSIRDLEDIVIERFDIESLDSIFTSSNFWNMHVKIRYPDVPFEYVPNYYYNYTGQDIVSIVINYGHFEFDCALALARMNPHGANIVPHKFKISNVTNVKLLIDIIRPHFTTNVEIYNFVSDMWRSISIDIYNDGKYKLILEGRTYNITYRQAFGLLLHLICNDHSESAT